MTTHTDTDAQQVLGEAEKGYPPTRTRQRSTGPQGRSGASYASAETLASLANYLQQISAAAQETGWHSPTLIVSFGELEEEAIVVGVRWMPAMAGYVAEIR